jgi:hypothetical protein
VILVMLLMDACYNDLVMVNMTCYSYLLLDEPVCVVKREGTSSV